MNSSVAKCMPIDIFPFASLTAAFKIINTNGFPGALNYIRIQNTIGVPIIISFDGQYGHAYLKSFTGDIDLNAQRCSSTGNKKSLIRNKTKVYVKLVSGIPKTGAVIISGFYQD